MVSSCDPEWYDDCEDEWESYGGDETLAVSYDEDSPSNVGVAVRGSSTLSPNGIGITIPITAAHETAEWTVSTYAMTGGGSVVARLIFRNSSGQEILTLLNSKNVVTAREYEIQIEASIPPAAAFAELQIGVIGSNTRVWIDRTDWASWDESGSSTPQSPEYCDDRAASKENAKKDACENRGGTFGGGCTGAPASVPGGCKFQCITTCTVPAQMQIVTPTGF